MDGATYQYRKGPRYLHSFTRRHDKVDPCSLPDRDLLNILSITGDALDSLMQASSGDAFALRNKDAEELIHLTGVGFGTVRKLHAIYNLCDSAYAPGKRRTKMQREWLKQLFSSEQETRALLRHAHGDIFALTGTDHERLLAIPNVGPASVAKLFALFALCKRYAERQCSA